MNKCAYNSGLKQSPVWLCDRDSDSVERRIELVRRQLGCALRLPLLRLQRQTSLVLAEQLAREHAHDAEHELVGGALARDPARVEYRYRRLGGGEAIDQADAEVEKLLARPPEEWSVRHPRCGERGKRTSRTSMKERLGKGVLDIRRARDIRRAWVIRRAWDIRRAW
eukprot:6192708-Pleurochrysis_carterae.AAC.1